MCAGVCAFLRRGLLLCHVICSNLLAAGGGGAGGKAAVRRRCDVIVEAGSAGRVVQAQQRRESLRGAL